MRAEVQGNGVYYGNGSGNPTPDADSIVFVHGAGLDHSVWVMPARFFARHGLRVVAPDLPAHGRSPGVPLTTVAAYIDWIIDLLDALQIERTTLVGHSMGSLLAFATTARHPDRIERLALLGTAAPMPVGVGLLNAAADNHHAAIDMANTWSHSPRGRLGSSAHPGSSNLHMGMRLIERAAPGVFYADLATCNSFDAAEFGTVTDTPTLVLIGSEDQMTPAKAGFAVAASIPNSTTELLPGSGHSMLSEQPNQVLDALAKFVLPN